LIGIKGFSQALLEDYEQLLDDTGKKYLREMRQASHDMASLIDEILQLARVSYDEISSDVVDLTAIAQGLIAEYRRRDPHRVVQVDIHGDLLVRGDKRLLQLLLGNLLENAWKYTSNRPSAEIELGKQPLGQEWVYFVRDNGAGFDMQHSAKLFRAFQRLHAASEFEGTGIGLATVQRIVARHGGAVFATGSVNEGATFFFTLPPWRSV